MYFGVTPPTQCDGDLVWAGSCGVGRRRGVARRLGFVRCLGVTVRKVVCLHERPCVLAREPNLFEATPHALSTVGRRPVVRTRPPGSFGSDVAGVVVGAARVGESRVVAGPR